MSSRKKSNLFIGCLIIVMIVIYFGFGRKGPNPTTVTDGRLKVLKETVIEWADQHGSPPETLKELGLDEDSLVDHIGNPFIYQVNGRSVTISSLGADGKPGGIMFKADRIVTFECKVP